MVSDKIFLKFFFFFWLPWQTESFGSILFAIHTAIFKTHQEVIE